MACIITYKGKEYSNAEFMAMLHNGLLDDLKTQGVVSIGLPISRGEQLKQDLEDAKVRFRKSLATMQSGLPLHSLPEFVDLIKAYYKHNAYKVSEFVKAMRNFAPDLLKDYSDEDIVNAHDKVISKEIKTNEQLKEKVESSEYDKRKAEYTNAYIEAESKFLKAYDKAKTEAEKKRLNSEWREKIKNLKNSFSEKIKNTIYEERFKQELLKEKFAENLEDLKIAYEEKINKLKYEKDFKNELQKEQFKEKISKLKDKIKSDSQKLDIAREVVVDYINENRGEFKHTSPNALINLINQANKANSIYKLNRLVEQIENAFSDINYDSIKALKKLIKEKDKKSNMSISDMEVSKRLVAINPKKLSPELLDDYNKLIADVVEGVSRPKVSIKKDGVEVKNLGRNYTNEQATDLISKFEDYINEKKKQDFKELIAEYRDTLKQINVDTSNLTDQEVLELYNETVEPADRDEIPNEEVKTEYLRNVVKQKVDDFLLNELPTIDQSGLSEDDNRMINQIAQVDVDDLGYKQLGVLANIIDNIVYNNDFTGAGRITTIIEGQNNAKNSVGTLGKYDTKLREFSDSFLGQVGSGIRTLSSQLSGMAQGDTKFISDLKSELGYTKLDNAEAQAMQQVSKFEEAIDNSNKKALRDGVNLSSPENIIKKQFVALFDMIGDGTIEEQDENFKLLRDQLKRSIETQIKHAESRIVAQGELAKKIYDSYDLDNVNTAKEFFDKLTSKNDKEVLRHVKEVQKAWDTITDKLQESTEKYSNNKFERVKNYTSLVKKTGDDDVDLSNNSRFGAAFSGVNKQGSKTTISRNNKLNTNQYIDLDFDRNQVDRFHQAALDAYTLRERMVLSNAINSKKLRDAVGANIHSGMKSNLSTRVDNMMGIQVPITKFEKALQNASNKLNSFTVKRVLFGLLQAPKQMTVLVNTAVQMGSTPDLFFKSITAENGWDDFKKRTNIGLRSLTEGGSKRGIELSGTEKTKFDSAWNDLKETLKTNKVILTANELLELKDDLQKKFLVKPDVIAAEISYRAFYKKFIKETEGREVTDWSKENNEKAESYAKEMVDKFQNVSNQSENSYLNTARGGAKMMYDLLMPLASFSTNMRMRTNDSIRALVSYAKDKDVSKDAAKGAVKDLVGTATEIAVYNAIKIGIATLIYKTAVNALLKSKGLEEKEDKTNFADKWWNGIKKDALLQGTSLIGEEAVPFIIDQLQDYAFSSALREEDQNRLEDAITRLKNYQQSSGNLDKFTEDAFKKKVDEAEKILQDKYRYRSFRTSPDYEFDFGTGKYSLGIMQDLIQAGKIANDIYDADKNKKVKKSAGEMEASGEVSDIKNTPMEQQDINALKMALWLQIGVLLSGGADTRRIITNFSKEALKQEQYKYKGKEDAFTNPRQIGEGQYTPEKRALEDLLIEQKNNPENQ